MLQCAHADLSLLQRGDPFGGSEGGSQRGNGGDALRHRRAANRLLVEPGIGSIGGVEDQLDTVALDQVYNVRSSLFDLIHAVHDETTPLQDICRAMRSHQFESQLKKSFGDIHDVGLVAVIYADEDRSAARQSLSGSNLRLGEGLAEIIGYAHDLARGFHLWSQ